MKITAIVSVTRTFSPNRDYCCGHCGVDFEAGQTIEVADFGDFCSKDCVEGYAAFQNEHCDEEGVTA